MASLFQTLEVLKHEERVAAARTSILGRIKGAIQKCDDTKITMSDKDPQVMLEVSQWVEIKLGFNVERPTPLIFHINLKD